MRVCGEYGRGESPFSKQPASAEWATRACRVSLKARRVCFSLHVVATSTLPLFFVGGKDMSVLFAAFAGCYAQSGPGGSLVGRDVRHTDTREDQFWTLEWEGGIEHLIETAGSSPAEKRSEAACKQDGRSGLLLIPKSESSTPHLTPRRDGGRTFDDRLGRTGGCILRRSLASRRSRGSNTCSVAVASRVGATC